MEGKRSVEWSESSTADVHRFYVAILGLWGLREADRFLDQLQEFEAVVAVFPKAFIRSKRKKGCYIGLLNRHISVIYKISPGTILILALIDNRSNFRVR